MAKKTAADAAGRAITKLGGQSERRRLIGQYRDDIKSVRRGGHIKNLKGEVHN
jgi:hypothetical protein